uniref:(northern house mosquito) hypothetical protein n=1 Tax=Culex pipiens TaxID=7175 RepID=A0A8D8C8K2_CULPI
MGGVQALPEEHRPDAVGGHGLLEHGVPGLLDRFQPVAFALVYGCRGRKRHQRTGHVPRSVRRVRCWASVDHVRGVDLVCARGAQSVPRDALDPAPPRAALADGAVRHDPVGAGVEPVRQGGGRHRQHAALGGARLSRHDFRGNFFGVIAISPFRV